MNYKLKGGGCFGIILFLLLIIAVLIIVIIYMYKTNKIVSTTTGFVSGGISKIGNLLGL